MADLITDEERVLIDQAVEAGQVEKVKQGASAFHFEYFWNGTKLETTGDKSGWRGISKRGGFGPPKRTPKPTKRVAERRSKVKALCEAGRTVAEIMVSLEMPEWQVRADLAKMKMPAARAEPTSAKRKQAEKEARLHRVAELLAEGLSYRKIGEKVGLKKSTIERYVRELRARK